jgi:FKBP-type peptidyl-prolyl cis-trans isomerase (trigger factor)
VAKLVDALALGASPRKRMGVQVPPLAPKNIYFHNSVDHPLLQRYSNLKRRLVMIDIQGQISPEQILSKPIETIHEQLAMQSVALSSHLHTITVTVPASLVSLLSNQTLELFRQGPFEGFNLSSTPNEHIEVAFKNQIKSKIKSYFLQHLVIDFIFAETESQHLIVTNYPRLTSVDVQPDGPISYHFDISVADQIDLKEWKHFAFKSPKRKKYKDLDKQVISFIDTRTSARKMNPSVVEDNDWVLIRAVMVMADGSILSPQLTSMFWIKVGNQDVRPSLIEQLLGKQLESQFYTTDLDMHNSDDGHDLRSYRFLVTIVSIMKGSHFSMDTFKNTFKLKNKAEIHNKLMEVFSYRNDISQRKAIIDETFHLLLSKHRFEIPKHQVLRREEFLVHNLSEQPDYHVYKAQKDFQDCIAQLAEKQLKEEIIIDHIAHQENIHADTKDIQQYLHLIANKRLKEFVYFRPLIERIDDPQAIVNVMPLAQAVLREKALNYIIYTLTH